MAYQALTPFYIAKDDGTEEFVSKGRVFGDSHPYVKADKTGTLFEKLNVDDESKDDDKKPASSNSKS